MNLEEKQTILEDLLKAPNSRLDTYKSLQNYEFQDILMVADKGYFEENICNNSQKKSNFFFLLAIYENQHTISQYIDWMYEIDTRENYVKLIERENELDKRELQLERLSKLNSDIPDYINNVVYGIKNITESYNTELKENIEHLETLKEGLLNFKI